MSLGHAQHRLLKCEPSRLCSYRGITPGREGVSEPREDWKGQHLWCRPSVKCISLQFREDQVRLAEWEQPREYLQAGYMPGWIRTEKNNFGGVEKGLYSCSGDLASSLVQSCCEPAEATHSTDREDLHCLTYGNLVRWLDIVQEWDASPQRHRTYFEGKL